MKTNKLSKKSRLTKLVYLANPYSSKLEDPDAAALERHQRRTLEAYVGGILRKRHGVAFILPINQSAAMSELCKFGTGFNEWIVDDLTFISRCDEVWVLMSDGWKESIGVQAEIKFALDNKKPVLYIEPRNFRLGKSPTILNIECRICSSLKTSYIFGKLVNKKRHK